MKVTVFQSDKGDCLLLTTADNKRMLVDGGMKDSYARHVAPALGKLQAAGKRLDVVYLSHIDEDHIAGILGLMDDHVAWRVHDYQHQGGNTTHPEPDVPRPPGIGGIWHNAFHEQLGKNAGEIGELLAASAAVLSGHPASEVRQVALASRELVLSQRQSIQLTRRVGARQLGIPLNVPADGRLMMVRPEPSPIAFGTARCHLIGPFEKDLESLRKEWNEWLRKNREALATIRRGARDDEENMGTSAVDRLFGPLEAQADRLVTAVYGDREKVTVPNLASLMFYVEEEGTSLLLTGDGHWKDILAGLRHVGAAPPEGGRHVTLLKGQHHGSEHNWSAAFCRAITADHYVFCGNGAHENPDLGVLELLLESRLGTERQRSRNPEVEQPFTIWFNSSSQVEGGTSKPDHMKEIEKLMNHWERRAGNRLRSVFLHGSSFTITL